MHTRQVVFLHYISLTKKMKNLFYTLLFLLSNCASAPKLTHDYFWYSRQADNVALRMIESGTTPRLTRSKVDGMVYTCWCTPEYVDTSYRKRFPDVMLIKKVSKEIGKLEHF